MVLLWIKKLAWRWRWRCHAWKKIKFSWLVRLSQLRFKILHTCLHIHYWKWWVLIHMIGNQYWFIWSYDYWILQYSYNTVQSRKYWKIELVSAVKQSLDMFNNFFFHLNFVKIGGPKNVESHVFIGFH